MAMPPQVQAQLDEANRILAAANPPAEDPFGVNQDPKLNEPAANAPPAAPVPPTQAPAVASQPNPEEEETYQARYNALKGMYNKQVPELQQQVRDLTARLDQAVKRLETPAPAATPTQPPAPTADPQDIEAFGEDLVNMVKRTAERMYGGAARTVETTLTKLHERLTELERRLEGTTQTATNAAELAFFDRLTKLVPNWEEINEDDRFKAWCLEVDPVYGVPRQRALAVAQNDMNADRVAAVLRAYLGTTTPTPPQRQVPPVENQVSPRAVASAPPPAPANKPVITAKQVDTFYRDVAQGRYRGREPEQQRIEQVINDALAEGRIR